MELSEEVGSSDETSEEGAAEGLVEVVLSLSDVEDEVGAGLALLVVGAAELVGAVSVSLEDDC